MSDKLEKSGKKDIAISKSKIPTIQELHTNVQLAIDVDNLNLILNQDPPEKWIKVHPYVKSHRYLPIDKTEWLLRRIFKRYKIKITGQGTAFNGVWVTVRVKYLDPITNEWLYHDGIGAIHLQVKSGSSPADLASINNGSLSMAFPLAKTLAVKDACDHFGKAFGSDLNRKDVMPFIPDEKLQDVKREKEIERLKLLINSCVNIESLNEYLKYTDEYPEINKVLMFRNSELKEKEDFKNAN